MRQLAYKNYTFEFKNTENKVRIIDIIRKKYVILTPEEWVRQHVIHFLIEEKKYPKSLIAVERVLKINRLQKRFDIAVFHPNGNINLIVECKSY